MKTVIEKERKWLVKAWLPAWYALEKRNLYIAQFYTEDGWRYRREVDSEGNSKYYRLKKINVGKGINYEMGLEEITKEVYNEALERSPDAPFISKTRHIFEHDGRILELDVFHNAALIVLEIENVEMTDEINMPDWLKDYILMEVTGNELFSNSKLAISYDESYMNF